MDTHFLVVVFPPGTGGETQQMKHTVLFLRSKIPEMYEMVGNRSHILSQIQDLASPSCKKVDTNRINLSAQAEYPKNGVAAILQSMSYKMGRASVGGW